MKNPQVLLVGAGPGDPELITLKALKALNSADVILYDALCNTELLRHASDACIKEFVGKRYGCHTLSQAEINAKIIEYARLYGTVVRLKGGDPFVFGRASEEIEAALGAHIPVDVIPGISSAIAVPAMQGIPLTSRAVAESFWVTTGTTRTGEVSNDIKLAAQSSATVIILMAMSKLEEIADIFTEQGKASMPVAIIQNGTTSQERMITGTIRDIVFRAAHAGIGNPAVIVIGEVVLLHQKSWKQKAMERIQRYSLISNLSLSSENSGL